MNPDHMKTFSYRVYEDLRLKTLPVAVSFHDQEPQWPEKTRRLFAKKRDGLLHLAFS